LREKKNTVKLVSVLTFADGVSLSGDKNKERPVKGAPYFYVTTAPVVEAVDQLRSALLARLAFR
jgi:hypothetical protein